MFSRRLIETDHQRFDIGERLDYRPRTPITGTSSRVRFSRFIAHAIFSTIARLWEEIPRGSKL